MKAHKRYLLYILLSIFTLPFSSVYAQEAGNKSTPAADSIYPAEIDEFVTVKHKLLAEQKVVFLGSGSVAKCCLYYFKYFFEFDYSQLYIIDKDPDAFLFPTVQYAISKGANPLQFNINTDNLEALFETVLHLKPFDIVIDLTTHTASLEILKQCRSRNLLYINTSMESDSPIHLDNPNYLNDSIFVQHANLQAIASNSGKRDANVTTVVEFGMNPGLISVFAKQGILDIAKMVLTEQSKASKQADRELQKNYTARNHKALAEMLKIRVIHCSEIDTQIPQRPPTQPFFNTWSCVGLIEEGLESAEIQIGTHEKYLPFSVRNIQRPAPRLVLTKKSGKDIKLRSIVPSHLEGDKVIFTNINGRCIPHGEGLSLARYLASSKYAPTTHYAYQLSPNTDAMMSAMSPNELAGIAQDPSKWKVLNMYDHSLKGYDNVGTLFVLEENPITKEKKPFYFWTGSILNTDYTLGVLKDKYFGPTTIQVMAGVLSGTSWMVANRQKGLVFAENLDDSYILDLAKPFLGTFYSGPVTGGISLNGIHLTDLIVAGYDDEYSSVATAQ
jgi:homospermidine synthase